MGAKGDDIHRKYAPLLDRTLGNALAHTISQEFPRMGGERICRLCAEMILEVVRKHLRPREHLRHGQLLWMGIDVNDPPSRGKTIARTRLVPVVLDLHTDEDTQAILEHRPLCECRLNKAIRLCRQAYQQGALLSNSDLAVLLAYRSWNMSSELVEYERRTGTLIPRRATVHDVGTGLTHKWIICLKRFRDGKPADQIARETYHSIEAVDRYLSQYDRVRHCRQQGFPAEKTAYTLNCSVALVEQYLAIDNELEREND